MMYAILVSVSDTCKCDIDLDYVVEFHLFNLVIDSRVAIDRSS